MHVVNRDDPPDEGRSNDTANRAAQSEPEEEVYQGGPKLRAPVAPILIDEALDTTIVFFSGELRRLVDVSYPALMADGDFAHQSVGLYTKRKDDASAWSADSDESDGDTTSLAQSVASILGMIFPSSFAI